MPSDNNTVSAAEEKYLGYRSSAKALLMVGSVVGAGERGRRVGRGVGVIVGAYVGASVGIAVGARVG